MWLQVLVTEDRFNSPSGMLVKRKPALPLWPPSWMTVHRKSPTSNFIGWSSLNYF